MLLDLHCILFLQDIGGVEFGTGGGALRFAPLVVRSGKEGFEAGPSFLLCRETFPGFAVIDKDTGLINELEGDANYLFEAVGSVTGGGIVTAIFDPVKKGFNRLVYIVRSAEDSVVFLKTCGGDVGIGGIQVVQDGTGGIEAVSGVLVLEGEDEHFVKSREKNLSGNLVGTIVIVEECGGGVESIAKFGDLVASGVGWYDGFRAAFHCHYEGKWTKTFFRRWVTQSIEEGQGCRNQGWIGQRGHLNLISN